MKLTPTATPTGRVNLPMLTIGPALARRWEQGVRFAFWHRISPPKSGFGSDPTGIRTRVFAVRGRCPWPLDDGALPRSWKILPDARGFVKRVLVPAI